MKVLICGGGTGGHVFPAMAIAEALVQHDATTKVSFVGKADGLEATLVAQHGWPFFALPAAPLKRISLMRRVMGLGTIVAAAAQAWKILRQVRPDCVVGTGGYVAGPMLLVAALSGYPTVIHEQNSVPGIANRWLGRWVNTICTTFAEARRYFPNQKVVETGLPVRAALVAAAQQVAHRFDGVPTVLVMGGSGGARRINELMAGVAPQLKRALPACRVIHQTGRQANVEAIAQSYREAGIEAQVMPFIDHLEQIYPSVHLAISRSGAGSVVELAMFGVPTIFIPFPFATDNHQEMNARELVACGGALLLREQDATVDRLAELCIRLLTDRPQLQQMGDHMRQATRRDAASLVAALCRKLAA